VRFILLLLLAGCVLLLAVYTLRYREVAPPLQSDDLPATTTTPEVLPNDAPVPHTTIDEYLRTHITELSPAPAVLGGTWYVTSVHHTSPTTLVVQYEDGHIALTADVQYTMTEQGEVVVEAFVVRKHDTEPSAPYANLTETEARTIAKEMCVKGGEALSLGTYNPTSKTWWFDANLNATRPGCNPACVVSEETRQAEINWRCTGALLPVE
jgi:hypothetical protein